MVIVFKQYSFSGKDSPLWHSTSGRPENPGKQRQTKNASSRIHSAFLPQPSVLQSTTLRSDEPIKSY